MFRFLSALFFLLVLHNSAHALTLEEAFEKAQYNNPTIRAAAADVSSAQEQLKQAKADFWPTLDAEASISDVETRVDGGSDFGGTPKTYGLEAGWTLYQGGSLRAVKKREESEFSASQASQKSTEQSTLYDVASAYLQVIYQYDVLQLQQNQTALLQGQLDETTARFDVGELTKTDVKQAEARLASARAEESAARGNLAIARAELRKLLGEETTDYVWPAEPESLPESEEELKQAARTNNPEIIAAEATVQARKHDVRDARSGHFPTLAADASTVRTEDGSGFTSGDSTTERVGLTASLPLFRGGRTVSEVRGALADQKSAEQSAEATIREIEQEVTSAWSAWEVAKANMEAFKQSVEANKVALEGVGKERELGERTVLEVLNARQEMLEAEVNLTAAKRDHLLAAYRILAVMGKI